VASSWECRRNRVIVYKSCNQWIAFETKMGGRELTNMMPQQFWEEMHGQAVAAVSLLGRVPDNLTQEIVS
jgi:hypothetical protein